MGPRLGHQQSTQRFSVRVFAAHSNHHGTWRNHQLCVSPFCLVLKAAPRDSCDLSNPPSVSLKVMFLRSGNLLRNSLHAPCTLTHSVRIEAKPKLDMVLLSLGTIVCVLSSPEVLSFKHGDKFSQRLDRRCYSDRHCTTKVKRLWNFSAPSHDTCTTQWNKRNLSRRVRLQQLHNWAIRWLNLQLSSHPQYPQQNNLQHRFLHPHQQ